MSLCLATPVLALGLAVQAFTLHWTHSVEKTEWQERWRIVGQTLVLDEARVRGSGAGMEPPDDAVLQAGWWVYPGHLPPLPALHLAVSGATVSGWTWCAYGEGCHTLEDWLRLAGQAPANITISVVQGRCRPP